MHEKNEVVERVERNEGNGFFAKVFVEEYDLNKNLPEPLGTFRVYTTVFGTRLDDEKNEEWYIELTTPSRFFSIDVLTENLYPGYAVEKRTVYESLALASELILAKYGENGENYRNRTDFPFGGIGYDIDYI